MAGAAKEINDLFREQNMVIYDGDINAYLWEKEQEIQEREEEDFERDFWLWSDEQYHAELEEGGSKS